MDIRYFCIFFFIIFNPFVLYVQILDVWATKSSLGFVARAYHTSSVINDKIYVIGGIGNTLNPITSHNMVQVYDPSLNTWSTIPLSGRNVAGATSDVFSGKIYIIGGGSNYPVSLPDSVQIFDPSTNTLSFPATTGTYTKRGFSASSVVNGKIYVIGGRYTLPTAIDTVVNTLEVFDPSSNTWSTPMTTGFFHARFGASASVINNKIYVIGGQRQHFDGGMYVEQVEIFDPSTNTWTAPVTTGTFIPCGFHTASVFDGKIYIIGGLDTIPNQYKPVQVFDPATNNWSIPVIARIYTQREFLSSNTLNGKIYVIGGYLGSFFNSNEVLETSIPSTLASPIFDTTFLCVDKTENITVNNPNDFPVNVTNVSFGGINAPDFNLVTPLPLAIGGNSKEEIQIRFRASVRGLSTAFATVSFDIPTGYSQTVPLSAYGEQLEGHFTAATNAHLLPGEEVLFPIYAKSPMDLFKSQSFVLSLSYDPSHLEAYDYLQDNTLTSSGAYTINTDSAGYTLLAYQTLDGSIVSGGSDSESLPLVYVKFRSHLNSGDNPLFFHEDYPISYQMTFPQGDASKACIVSVTTPGRISLDSTCEQVSLLHDSLLIPSESYIEPIHPNPIYAGHAGLSFDVPREDRVKIDIVDVLGNTISTVLEETRKPGTYHIDWDTSKLPAGMYYVRLQTSNQTKTRQMVVVK